MKSSTASNLPIIPICASEGYRLWSQTYDVDPNPLLALEYRMLGWELDGLAAKLLLDVACGTGRWMAYALAKHARAVGVDLCFEMLQVASAKSYVAGRLAQADCHDLPFPDEIADFTICSFSIGYMRDPCRLIGELARTTRRSGTVVVSDLHPHARKAGWRRSFRKGQAVYDLESYPYSGEQLLDYGHTAGLRLRNVLEPRLGRPEQLLMHSAGRGDRVAEVSAIPAILCIEWERP